MNFQFLAIAVTGLLLFTCSARETTVTTAVDSVAVDTTFSMNADAHIGISTSMDSTVFFGVAGYFKETKEFYVPLYYRQESDNYVDSEQLDSTISEKDGKVRKRLPLKDARKEFYLEEMERLQLFDSDHRLIGNLALSRVEYVENVESAQFVAVYGGMKTEFEEDKFRYVISANFKYTPQENFGVEEIDDQDLNKNILQHLSLYNSGLWVMHHLQILPDSLIYSTVSNDTSSMLVETFDNSSSILQEGGDDFYFGNITPLPIKVHGKPLILVDYYVPETDITGNFVSAFNGTTYEGMSYNRIPLDLLLR
jgi:hypothetical protein